MVKTGGLKKGRDVLEDALQYCTHASPEERAQCVIDYIREVNGARPEASGITMVVNDLDIDPCQEGRKYAASEEDADAFEAWCRVKYPSVKQRAILTGSVNSKVRRYPALGVGSGRMPFRASTRKRNPTIGDRIRAYFEEGILSDAKIAALFPTLTEEQVSQLRIGWQKLVQRPQPKAVKRERPLYERIIELYRKGFRLFEIAKKLSADIRYVERIIRESELERDSEAGRLYSGDLARRSYIAGDIHFTAPAGDEDEESRKRLLEGLKRDFPEKVTFAPFILAELVEFHPHTDEGWFKIGTLRLPHSILQKARDVIERAEFRKCYSLDVSSLSTDDFQNFKKDVARVGVDSFAKLSRKYGVDPWKERSLPLEAGFLICIDDEGVFYTSDVVKGSVGGLSFYDAYISAVQRGLTLIGDFHFHYYGHITPSIVDLQGGYHYGTRLFLQGGMVHGKPLVMMAHKRSDHAWEEVIRASIWEIATALTPPESRVLAYLDEITPEELEQHPIRENFIKFYPCADSEAKIQEISNWERLYAPYFEVVTMDLEEWVIVSTSGGKEIPEAAAVLMIMLMVFNLDLLPEDKRSEVMAWLHIYGREPLQVTAVFYYYRTTFSAMVRGKIAFPTKEDVKRLAESARRTFFPTAVQAIERGEYRVPAPEFKFRSLEELDIPWVIYDSGKYIIDIDKILSEPPQFSPWGPARGSVALKDGEKSRV
jgi:hypothetical protein